MLKPVRFVSRNARLPIIRSRIAAFGHIAHLKSLSRIFHGHPDVAGRFLVDGDRGALRRGLLRSGPGVHQASSNPPEMFMRSPASRGGTSVACATPAASGG